MVSSSLRTSAARKVFKFGSSFVPTEPFIWHGEAVEALRLLLEQHRSAPFPSAVERGEDYGEVDAVMIDADIFGWGLCAVDGDLKRTDRERLQDAHDQLLRSLPAFPATARPYYETLLKIATLALGEDADSPAQ